MIARLHADEFDIDESLVRRLLTEQFPQWAALPLERVAGSGTSNAIYRLGDGMAARLPRRPGEGPQRQIEREHEWLPRLAPHLPLAIPTSLAIGEPVEVYPSRWAIHRWIEGEPAERDRIADPRQAATALASFIVAMRGIDATDGPRPGPENNQRGVPLAMRDASTRHALAACAGLVDVSAATAAWEDALRAPAWDGPPVWIHGDLLPGNLLVRDGALSAVMDFGCMGTGDPAGDVLPAWALLPREVRDVFRAALDVDRATWARGRGWALSWALIALPYYVESNPPFAALARRTIAEVLADHVQD